MSDNETYGLHTDFERLVAEMSCTRQAFWGRIGEHVDPELLTDKTCQLVMRACHSVATDHGRPPDTPAVVLQRIQRWHEEGRVKYEDLEAAEELVVTAMEDAKHLNEDAIVGELRPVLQRHAERSAVEYTLDAFGKKKNLGSVAIMLDKAYRIGMVDTTVGTTINSQAVDKVVQLKQLTRLGTGVPELDAALNGGLPRSCFGVVLGPQKSGKSMFLNHVACNAMVNGLTVAYASLEISEEHVLARMIANLVDLPSETIIDDLTAGDARARLDHLQQMGMLPFCTVKYFTPDVTTVQDIKDWVHREEEQFKVKIDVVLTDYVQLIGVGDAKIPGHRAMKIVSQQHRGWAAEEKKWVWTGCQPKGSKDRGSQRSRIGMDDAADGLYITRTCDLGVSLNPREDNEIMYHVAGFRHGEGGQDVGPYPTRFGYGRMSHVSREGWPFWSPELVDDFDDI